MQPRNVGRLAPPDSALASYTWRMAHLMSQCQRVPRNSSWTRGADRSSRSQPRGQRTPLLPTGPVAGRGDRVIHVGAPGERDPLDAYDEFHVSVLHRRSHAGSRAASRARRSAPRQRHHHGGRLGPALSGVASPAQATSAKRRPRLRPAASYGSRSFVVKAHSRFRHAALLVCLIEISKRSRRSSPTRSSRRRGRSRNESRRSRRGRLRAA
jgi:hypothetical protein